MADKRIEREKQTVTAMISLYCQGIHGADGLCRECAELEEYSLKRLMKCPFEAAKPTCVKCTAHCYQPAMREKIRQVMRYSGPRMVYRHPLMALAHLIDGRRSSW